MIQMWDLGTTPADQLASCEQTSEPEENAKWNLLAVFEGGDRMSA